MAGTFNNQTYDIAIIGAGITGLAAAYYLSKKGKKVCLVERDIEVGGLLSCYQIEGYSIEKYYHHILPGDIELLGLFEELGLKDIVHWLPSSVGYWMQGKEYPLNTPWEVFRFPFLSFQDKWKLARLMKHCNNSESLEDLDSIPVKEWILQKTNESVYQNFFYPLLRGKYGDSYHEISAAWLKERIKIRSNRSFFQGEKLAYPEGGFAVFLDRLMLSLKEQQVDVFIGTKVEEIIVEKEAFQGIRTDKGIINASLGIYTGSPSGLAILGKDIFAENYLNLLRKVPYQHTLCLLLGLKQPLILDYWLNIGDERLPFSLMVEHTNYVKKGYGDTHILYLAAYYQNQNSVDFSKEGNSIFTEWTSSLELIYPGCLKNLKWWKISKALNTSPIFKTGYLEAYKGDNRTQINGLFHLGMSQSYPERSLNNSIKQAKEFSVFLSK